MIQISSELPRAKETFKLPDLGSGPLQTGTKAKNDIFASTLINDQNRYGVHTSVYSILEILMTQGSFRYFICKVVGPLLPGQNHDFCSTSAKISMSPKFF